MVFQCLRSHGHFPLIFVASGFGYEDEDSDFLVSAPAFTARVRLLLLQCRFQKLSAELRIHFDHLISLRSTEFHRDQTKTQLNPNPQGEAGGT